MVIVKPKMTNIEIYFASELVRTGLGDAFAPSYFHTVGTMLI